MRADTLAAGAAFICLIAIACSSSPAPTVPKLLPPETFDWSGEKISFAIPPAGWRREGETSGGIKGVRFVKERSVGEAIGIGDYSILAEQSRAAPISLGDVIASVEFKPERRQNPEYYQVLGRRETVIAGQSAVVVDYTVKVPERPQTYSARETYFVHNSHLFICTFIGLQESLAVFEAILASIEFPK